MKTDEGKVKDSVKAYLAKRGAYVFMPVQTGYGKRTLDILFCLQGQFGIIETKAPGKVPDGFQQTIMAEVKAAGGWVCWGDNAPQIIGYIQQSFPEQLAYTPHLTITEEARAFIKERLEAKNVPPHLHAECMLIFEKRELGVDTVFGLWAKIERHIQQAFPK